MCASKLLNKAKKNNNIIEREVLAMVFALHKFKHYLLVNKFFLKCRSYGIGFFGH